MGRTLGNDDWLITIAASAGGIQALQTVLADLPGDLNASIVIVQHRQPLRESILDEILARRAHMPVETAQAGDRVQPGVVYLARPDFHLVVTPDRHFAYVDGTRIRGLRSSANPLFATAAAAFRDRTMAVVLTGSGFDATDGVQSVKATGGIVIAQEPASAQFPSMPSAAIRTGVVDYVLPLEAIGPAVVALTRGEAVGQHDATPGSGGVDRDRPS